MANEYAKGNDSAKWQDMFCHAAPPSEDIDLIWENSPPRRIQVLGEPGALKLKRTDLSILEFSSDDIEKEPSILAACYLAIVADGTTCTRILVSW